MFDNIETIFDDKERLLKKLKKHTYVQYMEEFRSAYGHFFDEMTELIENSDDKERDLKLISDTLIEAVNNRFSKNGKIKGRVMADLNFYMIYYTFPAILLTEKECADEIAAAICTKWGESFKDSKIGYTTYEKLLGAFKTKIWGIF